jgi:hypothetical protein
MHREIDTAQEERLFDLFREEAFVADRFQWTTLESIARGTDDLNAALIAERLQMALDMVGLPECEL